MNLRAKWYLPISPLRIANPEQELLNATERQMAIKSKLRIFIYFLFLYFLCMYIEGMFRTEI